MMTIVYMVAGAALAFWTLGPRLGVLFLFALFVSFVLVLSIGEDRR
jgi:glucose dehydrogenase